MTPAELELVAKALYESRDTVAPKWGQLGDVTRSVWIGYVLAGQRPPTTENHDEQA